MLQTTESLYHFAAHRRQRPKPDAIARRAQAAATGRRARCVASITHASMRLRGQWALVPITSLVAPLA